MIFGRILMVLPGEQMKTMPQTDGCQVMAAWNQLLLIEHSVGWVILSKLAVLASESPGGQNLKAGSGGTIIKAP